MIHLAASVTAPGTTLTGVVSIGWSCRPAIGAFSSRLSLDKCSSSLGPSHTQAWYFYKMYLMYSYSQDRHYAILLQIPLPKMRRQWQPRSRWMSPARDQNEAEAIVVARPLGIQLSIYRLWRLLIQTGLLLGWCSYKIYASTQCYGSVPAIECIHCCSPRVGGGRLLKGIVQPKFYRGQK